MLPNHRLKRQDELIKIIEIHKEKKEKVVFTNGVFDFLHIGHIELLYTAKSLGDILIVAINSNKSTQLIKGIHRPINDQEDRALVLASLRCVDYVTIFEETNPKEILNILKPSIHVKGGDYNPKNMPETPVVYANGGEVIIVPLKKGYSNTKQYIKIQKAENSNFKRPNFLGK